jgi:hypothetical protein
MQVPESLQSISASGTSIHGPMGPAIQAAFAGAMPPTVSVAQPGASVPIPVVLVGHFNDRRSPLCTVGETQADAQAACRSRLVVDAVAWVNGTEGSTEAVDWRAATDPHPSPALDPVANAAVFVPGSTLLSLLVTPGSRIADVEPTLARAPTDLTSEPTLWVVTVLEPSPMPSMYKGVYIAGPVARTLLFTADGRAYEDAGAAFESLPIR